jgi:dTDP-4-amino-4,6-dideoxygalactose transaminase
MSADTSIGVDQKIIPFNRPPSIGLEAQYVIQAIESDKISGDGAFTKSCHEWMEENLNAGKALLSTSGTSALEMSAILAGIEPGDEVIMPSYTFVSTANAFVIRGAAIVFVDIRPDTMNIDEKLIEAAVTEKTKAIVVVHYAGVGCEMDTICDIAQRYGLFVIEDAAQAMTAKYKGRALGTIGDFGCISFHETKNFSMGEGGAILIHDVQYFERAEIIREKGTNRSKFFRGEVDKYSWVDIGSSFLPSDINAAYLYPQLLGADRINENRMRAWELYDRLLQPLSKNGKLNLPVIPADCEHNAHMYYIKTANLEERSELILFLRENGIGSVFHYLPLHSSDAGKKYGRFHGVDSYTTKESERLLRLPMYYGLLEEDVRHVAAVIEKYYG